MEKMCPSCHRPNPSDAAFCRHCAASLPAGMGGQPHPPHNQQWHQPPPANAHGQANFAAPPNAGASGRAITALILTICSFLFCCLFASIPAAILGWMEVSAIKEGRAPQSGMAMAKIGLWGGLIVSALVGIFYAFYLLMILAAESGGGYYY